MTRFFRFIHLVLVLCAFMDVVAMGASLIKENSDKTDVTHVASYLPYNEKEYVDSENSGSGFVNKIVLEFVYDKFVFVRSVSHFFPIVDILPLHSGEKDFPIGRSPPIV